MTQPISWVQDLIQRLYSRKEEEEQRQKQINRRDTHYGVEIPRSPQLSRPQSNVQSYLPSLNLIRELSQAGTKVEQQMAANRARHTAMAAQQKAIDLSDITPRMSNAVASAGFIPPLEKYKVTSGFGPRKRPTAGATTNHRGVDLAAPMGTPIYATHSGTVVFSGWSNGYGYHVVIDGPNGLQTFYGHNSRNTVKTGQKVQQGQLIGYVGSTGVSTGPHLHYEVRINGRHVNPAGYL